VTSIRDAFGNALADAGHDNPNLVVVNCDLGGATRLGRFAKEFPDRAIECGIAEANAIGIATGLALEGFRPVVGSFGAFITGKNIEIRTSIAYNDARVVIVGTHGGMIGPDGATQAGTQDIAVMRSISGMNVYQPATPNEARCIAHYVATSNEMCYVRVARNETPELFDDDRTFTPGRGKRVLAPLNVNKTIITSGPMLHNCLKAAHRYRGIQVINMPSIKPLDVELIHEVAWESCAILVVEDHSTYGGLGEAVAREIAAMGPRSPVHLLGIDDFVPSGTPTELEKHFGLDADSIKEKLRCL
jgi:transketolase